jgi:Zn finger protein HypA/HybF involved in hydrogenase expression
MSNRYRTNKPEWIAPEDRRKRKCLKCNQRFTTHRSYFICPECTNQNRELSWGAIEVHQMGVRR